MDNKEESPITKRRSSAGLAYTRVCSTCKIRKLTQGGTIKNGRFKCSMCKEKE